MKKKPWIEVTGQTWKYSLGTASLVIGVIRLYFLGSPKGELLEILLDVAAALLVILGFALFLNIRCPHCKKSPLKKTWATSQYQAWSFDFLALEKCPLCGANLLSNPIDQD